jgi:RNA-directed DNA polymerase
LSMGSLIKRIVSDLLLPPEDVRSMIRSAPMRYKVYRIPKRSGRGDRIIAQPVPAVKELQRWATQNILSAFTQHEAATAYRRSASILTNARVHRRHRYLLKLDFENFFNSIVDRDFLAFLHDRKSDLDEEDRRLLCRMLFWRPKGSSSLVLSIGAPSSPMVSNLLLFDFDERVAAHCAELDVAYTRYADDLTFSCNEPWRLRDIEAWVGHAIQSIDYPRLRLNKEKTVHASMKSRRVVTGLVLANDEKVSLGRERKRQIRAMVHRFLLGAMSVEEAASLRGWLAFVNGVEPSFLDRLERKYGPDRLRGIWRL